MKDSERISNLEEMLAEILIRLDSVDNELVQLRKGQSQTIGRMDSLEENMRDLAKHMFLLNDRQTLVEDAIRTISATNKIIFETMATKEDLKSMATRDDLMKMFDYMVDRFDKSDARLDKSDARLDKLEARFDKSDARFDEMMKLLGKRKGTNQSDDSIS
jgi:chromosome segregation ATPase